MADTGFAGFPGGLDPRAAEFRPTFPFNYNQLFPVVQPQIYYPYHPCHQPYPQFTAPPPPPPPQPAYVSLDPHHQRLPPTLPPPSTTPSRTLLLSSVPPDVSESTVRRELEIFGDVRAVQMERARDGIVTVHFYNLRDADEALVAIQMQHMQQQFRLRLHFEAAAATHNSLLSYGPSNNFPPPLPPPARGLISGHAVWAQFIFPVTNGLPHGHNQGTIVIFNLDQDVSAASLKEIFQVFGPIKELRETPLKRHQKFIEFYDTRDAQKALEEMNDKEINGKNVVIEFSRPGGHSRRFPRIAHNHPINSLPRPPLSLPSLMPPSPRKYPSRPMPSPSSSRCYYNKGSGGVESGYGNGIVECNSNTSRGKKNGKKCYGSSSSSVGSSTGSMTMKQQYNGKGGGGGGVRPWKGGYSRQQGKDKFDPRFLINEDGIMLESNCMDSRTTVMIKNIPNKYSQKLLLNMLDNHCIHFNEKIGEGEDQPLSSYDFVYLPIDFVNKCNVGYGFVNMTSPQATWRLYKAFHHKNWEVFNSRKICEVTYARLQGVEALKEHFKNSKFPSEADEYMPVVFLPPRDGRTLTEPNPIVGRDHHHRQHNNIMNNRHCIYSSPVSVTSEDEDEDEGSINAPPYLVLLVDSKQNPADSGSVNHINEDGGGTSHATTTSTSASNTSSSKCSVSSCSSSSSQNGCVNGDD